MLKSRFFKESKLRKYKNKAIDLVEKGKYKKALAIYRDILEAFPDDTTIMLKVGDLCRKLEMRQEAISIYMTAAEHHAQTGRLMQAMAVCKIILEIDKDHRETQKKLASLYAQKYGKMKDHRALHYSELPSSIAPRIAPSIASEAAPAPTVSPAAAPAPAPAPAADPDSASLISPAAAPSISPAAAPSISPAAAPSISPAAAPSISPAAAPSISPAASPSISPAAAPSVSPAAAPSDASVDAVPPESEQTAWDESENVEETASVLLGAPEEMLGEPEEMLGAPEEILGAPEEILGAPEEAFLEQYGLTEDEISAPAPEVDMLSETRPVTLDLSDVKNEDSEDEGGDDKEESLVYDWDDIEEYKRQLIAEGLLKSGDDLSQVDSTQETGLTGVTKPDRMVLTLSVAPKPVQTLPPIPLFSGLDESALYDLINELPMRHYEALETVVKEGEHGDSFFIIATGSVEIFKNNESLATLEEGAFFGEMAMLFPGPRQASVITAEPCDLFEVSNAQLEDMTVRHPLVGNVLLEFAEQRLLDNLLNTSPIFAPFSDEDRQSLMDKFEPYLFEAGTMVVEEGFLSAGLYLIVAGSAEATMSTGSDGGTVHVGRLKGNDIFGEVSLLSRSGAIATVTTLTQCRVLMLPKARFDELIMTHPQVLELVASISDERVATLNEMKEQLAQGRRPSML